MYKATEIGAIDAFLAKREELKSTEFPESFIEEVCPRGRATQATGEAWRETAADKIIEPKTILMSKLSLS